MAPGPNPADADAPSPGAIVATGPQLLALSHPLRVRILEALHDGPATASALGRRLGESSGATSYHLRQLARAGLVDEAPTQPSRRERWWRRTSSQITVPTGSADPDVRAAEGRLRSFFIARDEAILSRFLAAEGELEQRWRTAAFVGSWELQLTADDADELGRELMALFERYRALQRALGAQRVGVTFRVLPIL